MKKLGVLACSTLAIVLLLGTSAAWAQNVGDNSVYFVTYFANANVVADTNAKPPVPAAPDQVVRLVNDGDSGADLWASFYVFDDSEELQDCCSCVVTPDGLLSESVNNQLASFEFVLTPVHVRRGVIKVISSSTPAGGPSYTNTLRPGLRGYATHTQSAFNRYPFGPAPYTITEAPLAGSNLIPSEKKLLENLCQYAQELGSGFGVCTCTPEDHEF